VMALAYEYDHAHQSPLEENARPFSGGFATIRPNYSWGFIDKNRKKVVEPVYTFMSSFQDGLLAVDLNGKCGYVDTKGKMVTGLIYDKVGDFEHGIAPVYRLVYSGPPADDYDTLGYIDTKGIQYWED